MLIWKRKAGVLMSALLLFLLLYVAAYIACVRHIPTADGCLPAICSTSRMNRVSRDCREQAGSSQELYSSLLAHELDGTYRGVWRVFDPLLFLDNSVIRRGFWSPYFMTQEERMEASAKIEGL